MQFTEETQPSGPQFTVCGTADGAPTKVGQVCQVSMNDGSDVLATVVAGG